MRWTFATVLFLAVMGFSAYFVFNEAVKGGVYVLVPDVTGMPITSAANILAQAGLFAANTGGPVVVLTFEPHPLNIVAPDHALDRAPHGPLSLRRTV